MGIHDQTFRAFAMLEGFLEAFLRERLDPALVRQFAGPPEMLSERFVDQHLKGTIADLVVRIPLRGGRNAYVYFVLEHKRTQERALAIQLLKYQASLYAWLLKQRPASEPPAFVVTMVVYNGVDPWRLGRSFCEILGIEREHRREALDFKVHVLDLGRMSAQTLSKNRTVRGGLTALKAATVRREAQARLMRAALDDLTGDHSTRAMAVSYFQHIGQVHDVEAALEDKEERTQMQTAAQYYKSKGRKEGRQEGREEGRKEGLRLAITRLLGRRATKTIRARLEKANLDTLESMLEKLIAGRAPKTVFKS